MWNNITGVFIPDSATLELYIGKKLVDDDIITKQWLMMVIIGKAFDHEPTMQEVADALSTTHQNVKQLAVRLEARY